VPLLQQYRIRTTLRAVDAKEGRGFVIIPEDAMVTVTGHPDKRHFVPVRWKDRDLFVFEQDLISVVKDD
jgi:hypothetical protein